MIISNNMAKSSFSNYSNKDTKLAREVKNGKLIKIKNGLYETDSNTPAYLIAGSIYGPSYISFEYALFYYGLIPEKVNTITSATLMKKKKKLFKTSFGIFTYRDIPSLAYPEEIILKTEGDYIYQIASLEKAICDKLYTLKPLKNYNNLENMIFNDLRIEKEDIFKLNKDIIDKLSELYHSTNITLFAKYLKKYK